MMKRSMSALMSSVLALGIALPAFAEGTGTGSTTKPEKVVDLVCMKAAVEVRENAVATAWGTFSTSTQTALSTKKSALIAAWSITNKQERRTAIRSAWKTFRNSKQEARKAHKASVKSAWKTFKTSAKQCGGNGAGEESGSESQDGV